MKFNLVRVKWDLRGKSEKNYYNYFISVQQCIHLATLIDYYIHSRRNNQHAITNMTSLLFFLSYITPTGTKISPPVPRLEQN